MNKLQCWICKDDHKYDQWKMEDHFKNEHDLNSNTVNYVGMVFRIHKSIVVMRKKLKEIEFNPSTVSAYETILLNDRIDFAKSFLETI